MAYRVMLQPLRRPVVGRFAASGSDRAASAAGGSLSGGAASAGGPVRLRAGPGIAAAAPVQSFPAAGGRPFGPASRQTGFTIIELTLTMAVGVAIIYAFTVMLNQNVQMERDRASARTFQQAVDAAVSFYTLTPPGADAPRRTWPRTGADLDMLLPTLDWDEMLVGNGSQLRHIDRNPRAMVRFRCRDLLRPGTATTPWEREEERLAREEAEACFGALTRLREPRRRGGAFLSRREAEERALFFNVWAPMENEAEARRVRALLGPGAMILDPPGVLLSAAPPGESLDTSGFAVGDCPAGSDDPGCVIRGQMTFNPDAVLAMRGTLDLDGAPAPGRRARLNVGADAVVDFDPASRVEGRMTFDPDAALRFRPNPDPLAPAAAEFRGRSLVGIDGVFAEAVAPDDLLAESVDTDTVEFDVP